MSTISINLSIKQMTMPGRDKHAKSHTHHIDILEKVKNFIEDIEAGCDETSHQWDYLKSLFLALQAKKSLGELEKDLLGMVEPIILKYCEFDPPFATKIEGHLLNRHTDKD